MGLLIESEKMKKDCSTQTPHTHTKYCWEVLFARKAQAHPGTKRDGGIPANPKMTLQGMTQKTVDRQQSRDHGVRGSKCTLAVRNPCQKLCQGRKRLQHLSSGNSMDKEKREKWLRTQYYYFKTIVCGYLILFFFYVWVENLVFYLCSEVILLNTLLCFSFWHFLVSF